LKGIRKPTSGITKSQLTNLKSARCTPFDLRTGRLSGPVVREKSKRKREIPTNTERRKREAFLNTFEKTIRARGTEFPAGKEEDKDKKGR